MIFEELMQYCRIRAIENTLMPTEESTYRSLCREYSQKFHVSLPQVYLLDPEHVMGEVFEAQLEEIDIEGNLEAILDQIYTLEDPEYQSEKEKELEDFIEMAEAEEEERIKQGKPIHKAIKKALLETTLPPEVVPTRGSVNFGELKNES